MVKVGIDRCCRVLQIDINVIKGDVRAVYFWKTQLLLNHSPCPFFVKQLLKSRYSLV